MSILSVSIILFLIMDPLGNVAHFLQVLNQVPKNKQKWTIFREMLIALLTMVIFYFVGDLILDFLELSNASVSLTSGVILFLVAIRILFPSERTPRVVTGYDSEPFLVPLAIPMIAGPALLATIMLFSHKYGFVVLPAILVAWILASAVLTSSGFLMRTMGKNGLMAIERLMGMVLILLAIQRFLEGIREFLAQS